MNFIIWLLPYLFAAALGGIGVGFLANRRPDLFAKVVKVANQLDASANSAAAKIAPKASPPSTAPPKT